MTFDRPWVLAIAWLPLAWMIFEWRRTARRSALVLKALSLAAILIALAEPRLNVSETKVALAVLVDTSASVSPADLEHASQLADEMANRRGRHWMRVIPFARATRTLDPNEGQKPWKLRPTAGEAGRATDLEAAIREAAASLPAGMVPRIALISDGKQNKGSVARAAWQAQQLGIPIDTFALKGRPEPALHLESISLPTFAFTGEQFPIDVVVSAPKAEPAEVELSAEGRTLGKTQVSLAAGDNPIRLHASLNTPGALDLSIAVRASGEVRFDQAVMLRQPKVLYVTGDSPGVNSHLTSALAAAQFDIQRASDFSAPNLSDYQLVIFDNWDLENIPAARKADIERYVKQGGGVLVIGGERNMYLEGKEKVEDALDRTLPAKLAPPRSPEGTAVVLIIDKSSSMEGRKMELARLAAIGVVDNLQVHRHGGRADLRQFVPVGGSDTPRRGSHADQAPDLGHHARRRHADRARAERGLQTHPAFECDLQTHRAADRRNLRRRRQHGAVPRSAAQASDHFDGGPGPGREPGLSGEDRAVRRGQIVFPERARRAGTDPATRRDGTHRLDCGGEAGAGAEGAEANRDSGRRREWKPLRR